MAEPSDSSPDGEDPGETGTGNGGSDGRPAAGNGGSDGRAGPENPGDDGAAGGRSGGDDGYPVAPDGSRCLCPLGGVMDLLSRQYAMQLVCVVGAIGPARYGEIEATFGEVSSSTLSTRLSELVEAGFLSREQYDEIPPRVEYELTGQGEELSELLVPLLEWAERHDDLP